MFAFLHGSASAFQAIYVHLDGQVRRIGQRAKGGKKEEGREGCAT